VRLDGEAERAAELQPDRYYVLGDAGSFFFFESAGDNEGFGSPEAAAEWTRTQTAWPELDLSDGFSVDRAAHGSVRKNFPHSVYLPRYTEHAAR
jgi:hypothetical protein